MADPLSLSFGIAGLLSLGIQSVESLVKYYSGLRDRSADLARTASNLESLLRLLHTIENLVQTRRWRQNERELLRGLETTISRCEAVIRELQTEAQRFKHNSSSSASEKRSMKLRKAIYPIHNGSLKKLMIDVDYFRSNLLLALETLQIHDNKHMQSELEEIQSISKKLQAQQVASGLRSWLRTPDVSVDFNAASSKRHPSTGRWFTEGPTFAAWLKRDNSFLWLFGFAGCGKSVLCTTAIQSTFRHLRQTHSKGAVVFFFFNFRDESKQDATTLLRTLLFQLCGQVPGLETDLAQLKESCNDGTPPEAVLLEYLRRAIDRAGEVYILLDALDECPSGDKQNSALDALATMRKWALPGLHLLVTSRDYLDIRKALDVDDSETVTLQNDAVRHDIQRYVEYQLNHDRQLRRWVAHCDAIKHHLCLHANGICLNSLPKSLDATYERMLTEIDTDVQLEARQLLNLLCFASRPLTVAEVLDAMAVDIDDQECFDRESKLGSAEDLLRICPGLIEVHVGELKDYQWSQPASARGAMSCEIVRIAHFSVQEYLTSDRIRVGHAKMFALSAASGNRDVSKTCLIYLCDQDFTGRDLTVALVQDYPFAMFAARYWYQHYLQSDSIERLALESWISLLTNIHRHFDRWVRLYDIDRPWRNKIFYDEQVHPRGTHIYYLAFLGLLQPLKAAVLHRAADLNDSQGNYGTAINAASFAGHIEVVQLLVRYGADVNAQGSPHRTQPCRTALALASFGGHVRVVRILLGQGAEVNTVGSKFSNALLAASENGYETTVQLLLDHGADANLHRGKSGVSLQSAPPNGHGFQLSGSQRSALLAASTGGHLKVVQLLLERGAEVNDPTTSSPALQAAAYGGHEEVVRLLLEHGAEIDAKTHGYGTALCVAAFKGHQRVAQTLLERQPDVDAYGQYEGTALQSASFRGYSGIVQALLTRGADVNADPVSLGTALQKAMQCSHSHRRVEVMQMLLAHGANVNVRAGYISSPLCAAAKSGDERLVQTLIDHGAELNACGDLDGTALCAASVKDHVMVVQRLINHGAGLNVQGGRYGSALVAASMFGHATVARVLLDGGADVEYVGPYGTALAAASMGGHRAVVHLLLDRGADVNAKGGIYGTAIKTAFIRGHPELVQTLREHGADGDDTALQTALDEYRASLMPK